VAGRHVATAPTTPSSLALIDHNAPSTCGPTKKKNREYSLEPTSSIVTGACGRTLTRRRPRSNRAPGMWPGGHAPTLKLSHPGPVLNETNRHAGHAVHPARAVGRRGGNGGGERGPARRDTTFWSHRAEVSSGAEGHGPPLEPEGALVGGPLSSLPLCWVRGVVALTTASLGVGSVRSAGRVQLAIPRLVLVCGVLLAGVVARGDGPRRRVRNRVVIFFRLHLGPRSRPRRLCAVRTAHQTVIVRIKRTTLRQVLGQFARSPPPLRRIRRAVPPSVPSETEKSPTFQERRPGSAVGQRRGLRTVLRQRQDGWFGRRCRDAAAVEKRWCLSVYST